MAELHHKCHKHRLLFNEETTSPSDTSYHCAGCAEKVSGSSYSCRACRFYLHKICAEAPLEIHHPAHRDHPLLLLLPQKKDWVHSSILGWFKVKGFVYQCSSCEFCLDFNCALLPQDSAGNLIETLHVAHEHPLISINPTESFNCEGCLDPIKLDEASSACFDCKKFFHKKCLELPSTTNHPCHRTHQLLLVFNASDEDFPECNLCESSIQSGFFYRCVPCKFYIHLRCARPPSIIEDKSHHPHPFTLLLRPNKPFDCNACGNRGNHVSYICSTCNIQVHKDCTSLPRHIRVNLHPHPISHSFFICTDHKDSRDWECKICFEKVNIEYGSYYCSQPGCDFLIRVKCSIEDANMYDVVEVENPNDFEDCNWFFDEDMRAIIRVIKEIKVGDEVIAGEIEHVSHEHNLIFSDEMRYNKYCNGCVLPVLSSFYYCSHCDFFLHKACAELSRSAQPWFAPYPSNPYMHDIFRCSACGYDYSGFSYKFLHGLEFCLRCVSKPHSFTYQADEPHFLFYVKKYEGNCNACGKDLSCTDAYRCKDCTFALDQVCLALPHTAWHKCDPHSLKLSYRGCDDYPLRQYCDICEERRDQQKWFYHCETCDNAMHIECVLGEYPFMKAGSNYTLKCHPHPLTFVEKIYYYPDCVLCGDPCQELALECVEHGCEYIVHWRCIEPYFSVSDGDSDSGCEYETF